MSRQAHQKRLSTRKEGIIVEQQSIFEDSLLPAAEELAKLQEINPDIVAWIMERTSMEQETRHSENKERLNIYKLEFRGARRYNVVALIFAFVVIIAGLSFSTFLIYNSMNVMGTVFAGSTLVVAANAFIRASKKKQ
jgi:uncharacterized membrane protein